MSSWYSIEPGARSSTESQPSRLSVVSDVSVKHSWMFVAGGRVMVGGGGGAAASCGDGGDDRAPLLCEKGGDHFRVQCPPHDARGTIHPDFDSRCTDQGIKR